MGPVIALVLAVWSMALAASGRGAKIPADDSAKEVCFGRKAPNCSTVSHSKLIRREGGKVTSVKHLSHGEYAVLRKAIEKFTARAIHSRDCEIPVEIADFIGDSLVRVQSYCAPVQTVRTLKKRL